MQVSVQFCVFTSTAEDDSVNPFGPPI